MLVRGGTLAQRNRRDGPMLNKTPEAMHHAFNPMPVPGLSDKARQAVNAALDAMSAWRNETAEAAEKNGNKVLEKMAAAAAAVGWPEQVVDAVRTQMQSVAEIQIKAMDQILDA